MHGNVLTLPLSNHDSKHLSMGQLEGVHTYMVIEGNFTVEASRALKANHNIIKVVFSKEIMIV